MKEHQWLVPHLIDLITYSEKHALTEVAGPLRSALKKIAPFLAEVPAVSVDLPARPCSAGNIHTFRQETVQDPKVAGIRRRHHGTGAVVIGPAIWGTRNAAGNDDVTKTLPKADLAGQKGQRRSY